MSLTKLSKEVRLEILCEVHLVLSQSDRVQYAETPKADFYRLFDAIIRDVEFHCDVTHLIIQVLKKSPVWPRVLPFLVRTATGCKVSGCNHGSYNHGKSGKCTAKKYNKSYTAHTICTCKGFVQKTF